MRVVLSAHVHDLETNLCFLTKDLECHENPRLQIRMSERLVMDKLHQNLFWRESQHSLTLRGDRRRAPRIRNARPVYLRPADVSVASFEEVRTMADFSPIGFYFITARFECYRDRMKLYVIPAWG